MKAPVRAWPRHACRGPKQPLDRTWRMRPAQRRTSAQAMMRRRIVDCRRWYSARTAPHPRARRPIRRHGDSSLSRPPAAPVAAAQRVPRDERRRRRRRLAASRAARWCSRWSSSAASRGSRTRACRSPNGSRSSARCRRSSKRDWQAAFAKYRATPEYQLVNHGMTLDGVQGHLLVGICRIACSAALIGVAFLVPFLWFLRSAGAFRRATRWQACRRSSCSAGCRARWAGTWCKAASSTIRACRISVSPRISASRS